MFNRPPGCENTKDTSCCYFLEESAFEKTQYSYEDYGRAVFRLGPGDQERETDEKKKMQDAKIAFLFYFLLDFFPNTYATARINATKYPIIIWNTRSFNLTPPFKEVSSNIGSRSPGRG